MSDELAHSASTRALTDADEDVEHPDDAMGLAAERLAGPAARSAGSLSRRHGALVGLDDAAIPAVLPGEGLDHPQGAAGLHQRRAAGPVGERSGIFAAYAASDLLSKGEDAGAERYGRFISDEFARYRKTRVEVYAAEGRWPEQPFWRRRAADR